MVSGDVDVASTLRSRSLLISGTSFGPMTYALGSTADSSVGVLDSAPAGVPGLKPDHGVSRSTVVVPSLAVTRAGGRGTTA